LLVGGAVGEIARPNDQASRDLRRGHPAGRFGAKAGHALDPALNPAHEQLDRSCGERTDSVRTGHRLVQRPTRAGDRIPALEAIEAPPTQLLEEDAREFTRRPDSLVDVNGPELK
jgi:hypothetical protein